MKRIRIHSFMCIFLVHTLRAEIVVRPAAMADVPEVLELDRHVTYEYFKPLYVKAYPHLPLGQDPDRFLEPELQQDEKTFYDCVKNPGNTRLHIAYDSNSKRIGGLIVFHKEHEDTIELDLLLVDKDYRKMGIGRKLVYNAVATFKYIKTCIVYPVRHKNDATLKFYQSLGFKNLGVCPLDKMNPYGIKYSDMYFYFRLDVI